MTDNVVTFPGNVKAATTTDKDTYSPEDMQECFAAMHNMLLDPTLKVEGVAISVVTSEGTEQSTYSAFCSNKVAATLGGLLLLQKRIMEESK